MKRKYTHNTVYHRFLSSVLSVTLLWQVLSIPIVYASPTVDADETSTAEEPTLDQLAYEELINSSSKQTWQKISDLNQKITGTDDEEERLVTYLQDEENEDHDKDIARDYRNRTNWSLQNYLYLYYVNEDKRKRVPLLWGLVDNNLHFLPFAIEPVQTVVNETIELANSITSFLSRSSIPESDKIILTETYFEKIYGPMLGIISLFSDDPDSLQARLYVSNAIQIKVPYSFYSKFKDELKEKVGIVGIEGSSYTRYSSGVALTLEAHYLLKMLILAHLSIPSSHFYVTATRLQTISDMIDRNDYYKLALNDESPTAIPNSCRQAIGISFPQNVAAEVVDEETQEDLLNTLLSDNGLMLYKGTEEGTIQYSTYEEYYRDYVAASLEYYDGGFMGLLPFQDYFAANYALGLRLYEKPNSIFNLSNPMKYAEQQFAEPPINDVEHFAEVLNGKGNQIEGYLQRKAKVKEKDLTVYDQMIADNTYDPSNPERIYDPQIALMARDAKALYTELQEGITQAEELWTLLANFNVDDYVIEDEENPENNQTLLLHGVNQYLANIMIQEQVSDPDLVVPEHIVETLSNRTIQIQMPHMDAPDAWRKWALGIMLNLIDQYIDADVNEGHTFDFLSYFHKACFMYNYETDEIPNVCIDGQDQYDDPTDETFQSARQIMRNIRKLIVDPTNDGEILPRLSYDMDLLATFYPVLQRVWQYYMDWYRFPESTVSEWDYLVSQLPYNGWAILRITHLLIEEEFKTTDKYNDEAKKHYRHIAKLLKIDEPLTPFHATQILSVAERKIFWGSIAQEVDSKNIYLFNAQNEVNEGPYYKTIRSINDANIFDPANLNKAKSILGNNVSRTKLNRELSSILSSKDAEEISFLNQMYNSIANQDKLYEMADEYFEKFPITAEEDDILAQNSLYYIDIKSRYLKHESNLKKPLYHHALKEAAYLKLQETEPMMDTICGYVPFQRKGEKIDDYYSPLSYTSNSLKEYLDSIPRRRLEKVDYEVPREDYNDLFDVTSVAQAELSQQYQASVPKWAQKYADRALQSKEDVLALTVALGSALLYLISIPLSNGMTLGMAPQVASGIAAFLSVSAAVVEFISGGIFEMGVIIDAKERTVTREEFSKFGTMDSTVEVEIPYSYIWVILEVAFFSQLLGQVSKGIKLFTRTMYATKKGIFKGLTHAEKLAKYRGIARRVSTSSARAIFNINRRLVKNLGDDWFKQGLKALKFEYLRGFKGTVTPVIANQQFAKITARYFGDSGTQIADFLRHYPKRNSSRMVRRYNKYQKQLNKLISRGGRGTQQFIDLTKEIQTFEDSFNTVRKLINGAVGLSGGDVEEFLLKNIDDFCDISMRMGWRDWLPGIEVPYHVLITGMPAGNRRLPILRSLVDTIPGLATANDRILIQRIVSARQILLDDYAIKAAARTLGLAAGDASKFALRSTFSDIIEKTVNSKMLQSKPLEVVKINELYQQLANEQAQVVVSHFKRRHPLTSIAKMTAEEFNTALKAGDATAIAAFNNTPADQLYGLKVTRDTAHEIIQNLSKDGATLDEFETLLNALKLRSIGINPRKFFPELKYTI